MTSAEFYLLDMPLMRIACIHNTGKNNYSNMLFHRNGETRVHYIFTVLRGRK